MEKSSHSLKEIAPSPFSSMAANMFFRSSSPRAGRFRPSLQLQLLTAMIATNSLSFDCDQQNEILLHTSWESRWGRWWEWQTRPGPPCRPWIFLLQNLISVFQYLYLNYWQISFPTCQRLLYLYSEVFLIKHLVYLYFDVFLFPPVSICSLESFPVEEIERLVLIRAARAPALIWI